VPGRLSTEEKGGSDEEVVGRIVKLGTVLARRPDEWICSLWNNEGRLVGPVELEDSSDGGSGGAAPCLSVKNFETVVVAMEGCFQEAMDNKFVWG
jgi:hypothetical protein